MIMCSSQEVVDLGNRENEKKLGTSQGEDISSPMLLPWPSEFLHVKPGGPLFLFHILQYPPFLDLQPITQQVLTSLLPGLVSNPPTSAQCLVQDSMVFGRLHGSQHFSPWDTQFLLYLPSPSFHPVARGILRKCEHTMPIPCSKTHSTLSKLQGSHNYDQDPSVTYDPSTSTCPSFPFLSHPSHHQLSPSLNTQVFPLLAFSIVWEDMCVFAHACVHHLCEHVRICVLMWVWKPDVNDLLRCFSGAVHLVLFILRQGLSSA